MYSWWSPRLTGTRYQVPNTRTHNLHCRRSLCPTMRIMVDCHILRSKPLRQLSVSIVPKTHCRAFFLGLSIVRGSEPCRYKTEHSWISISYQSYNTSKWHEGKREEHEPASVTFFTTQTITLSLWYLYQNRKTVSTQNTQQDKLNAIPSSNETSMSPISRRTSRRIRGPLRSLGVWVQSFAKLQKRLDEKSESGEDQKMQESSFLGLAPELRNEVYGQLFPQGTKYAVRSSSLLPTCGPQSINDKTLFSTLAMNHQIRDEAAGIVAENAHGYFIIDGAVDLSSLPTWLTNSVRTLEMEGFLMQCLPERSRDYALCFPNLERIIIATYVANINLAWRASPNTPATDFLTIAQGYSNSRQSRKGKPLRMRDLAGNLMESIPERVRKITEPTAL